jgi:uncharacterized membrane protein
MSILGYIKDSIKRYFLSGILVIVPLIITYVVLRFFLSSIDGILSPLLVRYLGYDIPGLGIVITIIIVFVAGILTRGVLGRGAVSIWERFLSSLPLVRTIYSAAKQLLISVAEPKKSMFQRVVIIPYPRLGMYSLAFAASEVTLDRYGAIGDYVAVFIPSTPTPFTGYMLMVKKEEVFPTNMSVEEAVKFIVSGGIVVPEVMLPHQIGQNGAG